MTSGKAQPNLIDPDTSRERIELETRVLAAALRQSLEMGDTEGSSLAHRQIFYLLKASQEMGWEEPISIPPELVSQKSKALPDIDWGPADEHIKAEPAPVVDEATSLAPSPPHGPALAADNIEAPTPPPTVAAPVPAASPPVPAAAKSRPNIFAFLDFEQKKAESSEGDFYSILGLADTADAETIHRTFWRKVRPIVRRWATEGLVGAARKEMQAGLQKLWIAHDILSDPVTRADYDFRRIGLRGSEGGEEEPRGSREQVRIGELLRCAGLLETTELEIAADMHKAMPEIMFGTFLVKQGFIEEGDLDCVLLGQKLIKSGAATVGHFQEAMKQRAESNASPKPDLGEVLLAAGIINEDQLEEAYRSQVEDTIPRIAAVTTTVVTLAQSRAHELVEDDAEELDAEEEVTSADAPLLLPPASPSPANPVSIKIGNSLPSWKEHLDWGSPDDAPPVEPAAAPAEAPKQSLFDLMQGLKTNTPDISEPLPENVVLMSSVLNKAAEESAELKGESSAEAEQAYASFPDFAGEGAELHEPIDLPFDDNLEAEMSALDAAAEAAMFEEVQETEVIGSPVSSAEEITAEDLEAVRPNVHIAEAEASTSEQLPSVGGAARPEFARGIEKRPQADSSDEWKIVSMPGSDIASLFLGTDKDETSGSGSGSSSKPADAPGGPQSGPQSGPPRGPGGGSKIARRRKRN